MRFQLQNYSKNAYIIVWAACFVNDAASFVWLPNVTRSLSAPPFEPLNVLDPLPDRVLDRLRLQATAPDSRAAAYPLYAAVFLAPKLILRFY